MIFRPFRLHKSIEYFLGKEMLREFSHSPTCGSKPWSETSLVLASAQLFMRGRLPSSQEELQTSPAPNQLSCAALLETKLSVTSPPPRKKRFLHTLSLSLPATSGCIFVCFLRHFLKNLLLLVVVVVSEGIFNFKRQKNRQDDMDGKEFK